MALPQSGNASAASATGSGTRVPSIKETYLVEGSPRLRKLPYSTICQPTAPLQQWEIFLRIDPSFLYFAAELAFSNTFGQSCAPCRSSRKKQVGLGARTLKTPNPAGALVQGEKLVLKGSLRKFLGTEGDMSTSGDLIKAITELGKAQLVLTGDNRLAALQHRSWMANWLSGPSAGLSTANWAQV